MIESDFIWRSPLQRAEGIAMIRHALATMPEDVRTVSSVSSRYGLEIVVDIPTDTVASRLIRARASRIVQKMKLDRGAA